MLESARRSRPHPPRPRPAPAVYFSVLALVAAGCGGSTPPRATTTSGAASTPQNGIAAAYRYSRCMRSHGATGFPDPQVHQNGNSVSVMQRVPNALAHSPAFVAAQKACRGILPAPDNASPAVQAAHERARAQTLLAFARCLRSHGVPNFPDPSAQGQLPLSTVQAAGVDLQAPSLLTAAKACVGVTHGMITMAQVQQAVHGGH
jgi:hypothetical protein